MKVLQTLALIALAVGAWFLVEPLVLKVREYLTGNFDDRPK